MQLKTQIQRTITAIKRYPDHEFYCAWLGMAYWQARNSGLYNRLEEYGTEYPPSLVGGPIDEMVSLTNWNTRGGTVDKNKAREEFCHALLAEGYVDLAMKLSRPRHDA